MAQGEAVTRRVVVDHVALRVEDLAASRRFYHAALAPLGFGLLYEDEGRAAFGVAGADDFSIAASEAPSGGVHVAFASASRGAVDAFHAAALAAGGSDNGGPGLRPQYHPGYYGAFVIDADGNNLEAVHHTFG